MEPDLDEGYMEDVWLNDKIDHHWMMVFLWSYGGVDNPKLILHDRRSYVYINDKNQLLKLGILWKCQVLMGRGILLYCWGEKGTWLDRNMGLNFHVFNEYKEGMIK